MRLKETVDCPVVNMEYSLERPVERIVHELDTRKRKVRRVEPEEVEDDSEEQVAGEGWYGLVGADSDSAPCDGLVVTCSQLSQQSSAYSCSSQASRASVNLYSTELQEVVRGFRVCSR